MEFDFRQFVSNPDQHLNGAQLESPMETGLQLGRLFGRIKGHSAVVIANGLEDVA